MFRRWGGACSSKFIQTLTEINLIIILLSASAKRVFPIVYLHIVSVSFEDATRSFQLEGAFFVCLIIGLLLY